MRIRSRWTLAALGLAAATLSAPDAGAGDAAAGKTVYQTYCVSCHGEAGKGDGPVGAALNPRPRDFSVGDFKYDADGDGKPGADADLKKIVGEGAAAFGGSPLMAPWGGSLSAADIDNVIAFVRSLHK
jgi:mono/diheme cytochrome c family protein